jgi:hypothetical protein
MMMVLVSTRSNLSMSCCQVLLEQSRLFDLGLHCETENSFMFQPFAIKMSLPHSKQSTSLLQSVINNAAKHKFQIQVN